MHAQSRNPTYHAVVGILIVRNYCVSCLKVYRTRSLRIAALIVHNHFVHFVYSIGIRPF